MCLTQRVFYKFHQHIHLSHVYPNVLKANPFFDSLHEFVVRGQIDVESIDHTLSLNYLPMQ